MGQKEGAQDRGGEGPKGEERPGEEGFEPADTDYRRNVWILAVMLGVVVLAWLISLLSGTGH